MNLALLQRFAPLVSFATKRSSELTDADLSSVASALAGEAANDMLPFLQVLREKEPDQRVVEILSSDTARALFRRAQENIKAQEAVAFVKCPHCGGLFETELH